MRTFLDFGVLEIPPGGAKLKKNSNEREIVFFVFSGRVMVEIGTPTIKFGIGKGGMWQVPRGDSRSLFSYCCFLFSWKADAEIGIQEISMEYSTKASQRLGFSSQWVLRSRKKNDNYL